MLFDLKKARVESAFKDYRVVMPNLRVINSLVDALRELDMLKSPVAFDIECNEGVLTAIGFATSPMDGFSIVMDRFTFESRVVIMEKVKEILESPLPKIAQNAQFDILWLEHYLGIKVNNLILDTMCAHHTVYSEIPKGLETLTSIYTDFPYYKHWVHSNLGKYNAMDACATFKVYQSLMKEMEEFGVKEFYYKFVHPLLEPLMEMQLRGVRVDLKRREEMTENVGIEIRAKEVLLEQKLGFYVNVNSPKQLRTVLYDVLKMPKKFSRTTGKETVDEDALTELAKKYSSDVLELILDIRKLHKVKGTYLEAPLGEDGRMHTSYVIGGTETGRLASRRSLFGSGTNLQNVPKGACRSIFIPDEGKVFVEADLSQAEARIVAWESKDLRLIDIFVKGEDIHTKVASWIFDVKEVDVNEEQRQLAKKMVHAMNYGMGVRSLARWLGVSLGEATVLMEKYQRTFPAIEEWHKKIVNQLRHNRMLITPLGRKRLFFNRWGEDLFREAYAFIPQSTVADLLNLILVRTYKRMKIGGMDAQMVLQVHDSFVVQAKEEDVEKIKEIVNESNDIRFGDIVIPMKFKVGTTWYL
jgi:DNA polymerase-1